MLAKFVPSWADQGSGKSTLMNIIGIDTPTTGSYLLMVKYQPIEEDELSEIRNQKSASWL